MTALLLYMCLFATNVGHLYCNLFQVVDKYMNPSGQELTKISRPVKYYPTFIHYVP